MALYAANGYVSSYLQGRDFDVESSDYRYDYFDDTPELEEALDGMPFWYLILKANLWS